MVYHGVGVIAQNPIWGEGTWRHWCPASETYAPVEVLLQYLRQGWEADTSVAVETFFLGTRHSYIYRFTVRFNGNFLEIPVIMNPAALRVIKSCQLTLLHIASVNPAYDLDTMLSMARE
jgi:hypothetical protein